METLIIILAFVLGYAMGWIGRTKKFIDTILDNPDVMIQLFNDCKKLKDPDNYPLSAREVEVEIIDEVFYLYAKDNGQFLAQAATLDAALAIIEQQFPGQCFQGVVSAEDAKRMKIAD